MNMKLLPALLAAFVLSLPASAALSGGDGMTLLWHFDETGTASTVEDASGKGYNGTVKAGSAVRTAQDSNLGFSYRMLGQDGEISVDLSDFGEGTFSQRDWTFFCRFKNPTLQSSASMFIARGAADTAKGCSVAWNLALMPTNSQYRGCMRLALVDADGTPAFQYTEAPEWRQDVWYTLAVVSSWTNGLHNYKVYLSPDTAYTIGNTILDWTPTGVTDLATGSLFVFGGAQNGANVATTRTYGGFFNANVDETALWLGRALSFQVLNALRDKTTGDEVLELNDLAVLHYTFDAAPAEQADGTRLTADASGNGRDGLVFGGVRSSALGGMNRAFTGFTNQVSYVACTNLPYSETATRPNSYCSYPWTYLAYYRMPHARPESDALLARGSNSRNGQGSDNAWSLYLTPENRISLSLQDWNGKHTNIVSDVAIALPAGDWMQVAVCRSYIDSVLTYQIYMTPWGASEVTPVFSVPWPSEWSGRECNGKTLVIGGGERGYYHATQPAGWWGGTIDEAFFFDFVVPEGYLLRDLRAFQPLMPTIVLIK